MTRRPIDLTTGMRVDASPPMDPIVEAALGELTGWANTAHLVNPEDAACRLAGVVATPRQSPWPPTGIWFTSSVS